MPPNSKTVIWFRKAIAVHRLLYQNPDICNQSYLPEPPWMTKHYFCYEIRFTSDLNILNTFSIAKDFFWLVLSKARTINGQTYNFIVSFEVLFLVKNLLKFFFELFSFLFFCFLPKGFIRKFGCLFVVGMCGGLFQIVSLKILNVNFRPFFSESMVRDPEAKIIISQLVWIQTLGSWHHQRSWSKC